MLVLAVILVIFTLQNQSHVSVKLFFWTIKEIPIPLLIIICLLLGYLIPYISLISRIWRLKRELKRTQEENEELQVEQQEPVAARKAKTHPEGIAFEDDEPDLPQRKNATNSFFKE
jgi:uncharacterized integral membrane protein